MLSVCLVSLFAWDAVAAVFLVWWFWSLHFVLECNYSKKIYSASLLTHFPSFTSSLPFPYPLLRSNSSILPTPFQSTFLFYQNYIGVVFAAGSVSN